MRKYYIFRKSDNLLIKMVDEYPELLNSDYYIKDQNEIDNEAEVRKINKQIKEDYKSAISK